LLFITGGRGRGGGRSSHHCCHYHLIGSCIYPSNILEDSVVSLFRLRINTNVFWRSRVKWQSSQGRPRPYVVHNLPTLGFCSPLSHCPVTSQHLSFPTHALDFPALFLLPRLQPPSLCQVPEVPRIPETWLKSHLFWEAGRACHSLPSMSTTWRCAHLSTTSFVILWWS
jgi:hypothetical protein